MKYWFLVSLAVFAFLVSCGKKDKKKGQIGKTVNGQLDCKGKDKENKSCIDAAKTSAGETKSGDVTQQTVDTKSGGSPTETSDTIPNVKDSSKMAITLSDKTALMAEMKIDSEALAKETVTRVVCAEIKTENLNEANPDELQKATAQIYLFNGSTIAAHLKVNKGDKTDPSKLYMLSCANNSTIKPEAYKSSNEVETKVLKVGQQAFELIGPKNSDLGVVASFECGDDDQVLRDAQKSMGKRVSNRIRLRKGSSVMVPRNIDYKVGDKKLSDLITDDAQQSKKFTILTCNG